MAVFLLIAVGLLSLTLTRGLNFLTSISIVFIGVQVVTAINFHLLASRKSHEPFRFRPSEEIVISVAFALAGAGTLIGVLHAGNLAGWLAMGAAAAGIGNVLASRWSNGGRF